MSTIALATLASYGITYSENSSVLFQNMLDVAERACLRYMCRDSFAVVDHTEYFDGMSCDTLSLKVYPVTAVSLYISNDRNFTDAVDSSAYRIDKEKGIIILYPASGFANVSGRDVLKVVYSAGWETLPKDIEAGVAMTCQYATKLLQTSQVGISNRTNDGGVESIEQSLPPLVVQRLLSRYKLEPIA